MALSDIRKVGSAVIHAIQENVIKPIAGKFKRWSAARATPNASVAKYQPLSETKRPDTPLTKRHSVSHVEPRSILKQEGDSNLSKGSIQFDPRLNPKFDPTLESQKAISEGDYNLSNPEESFLRELFTNTRPGRVRQFIYKLHLHAPSHPPKEIAEFKEYLRESATTLEQVNDIKTFLKGEKLADCQVNRLLKEHQRSLVESRSAEIFVESFLAEESESGEALINNLKHLLQKPKILRQTLNSTGFIKKLGEDIGLEVHSYRRDGPPVLNALNLKGTSELEVGLREKLKVYLTRFETDPEEAQDYVDTRASEY